MNKKTLLTLLQSAITLGILAWLFRDIEKDKRILHDLTHAYLPWLFAAFCCYGVVVLAGITRWWVLLRVQSIHLSWKRLASLFMIGVFFNPLMPGGTGGDVAKIFYLLKETPGRKTAAMLAVLMDRLMGLFGLILIAGGVIALRYHWLTQTTEAAVLLYVLLLIFSASVGFILVSFAVTGFGLVHKLPKAIPCRDLLVDLAVAYNQYGRAAGSSLLALLLCVPVHVGTFALSYCVARAFTESAALARFFDFCAVMPIVNTIAAMPISIGGTGVREGLAIRLLGDLCHIPEHTAISIALTSYAVLLAWSVVGGVIFLRYRPSTAESLPTEPVTLAEMSREEARVEHAIAEEEERAEAKGGHLGEP